MTVHKLKILLSTNFFPTFFAFLFCEILNENRSVVTEDTENRL